MSDLARSTEMEAQIRTQLAEIDRRILNLLEIRDGLQRVLGQTLNRLTGDQRDARWNSHNRLVVESKILEMLENAQGTPVRTQDLFGAAKTASPNLKYSTFRSHLHRLKERGLIGPPFKMHGYWKLKG